MICNIVFITEKDLRAEHDEVYDIHLIAFILTLYTIQMCLRRLSLCVINIYTHITCTYLLYL